MKSTFNTMMTTWKQFGFQIKQTPYHAYHALISIVGIILLAWAGVSLLGASDVSHLVLLIALAAVSAAATTSAFVGDEVSITYTVGPAVAMAAVPEYGPEAAVIINAAHTLVMWGIKPANQTTWKKSWQQLAFNIGMHTIASTLAGGVLLLCRGWLGETTLLGQTVPWLVAAYLYEETNFWLLAVILRLQYGSSIQPLRMWREDYWATQIGTLVTAFGSGILAFAISHYNIIGIVIFFLPSVLSAYAFRLFVRRMRAHLDNLEQIVAERTKELAERTEQLAELNRQKDAFLAVLTHDMVTPLTSIQMYAELIQADPEYVVQNPELGQIMLRSQQTVFNLVKNILDIEKIAAGTSLSIHKVRCDITELAAETLDIIRPEAEVKNITIDYCAEEAPVYVLADPQQMQRILLNLMSNSVKYTPSGGGVKIQIATDSGGTHLHFRDSGYGIAADELPYIFDRFKRIEKLKDKAAGTGLGLAITKALVEEHDGTISVTSEVGKGSTFVVTLPVAPQY